MIFKGQNLLEFIERFKTDNDCRKYLSEIKWGDGFKCIKCGNVKYTVRKANHARDCNRCHHVESPTAGTMFHKVKFGVRKAFMIAFEMTATTKSLSAMQVGKRYGISRKTAWLFMHKVRNAMQSSEKHPVEGDVQIDEFVVGGHENLKQGRSKDSKKKKVVGAVELTDTGKIKRVYLKRIADFSAQSLQVIFDKHISRSAQIFTDKWTGYKPLMSTYNIEQNYSIGGTNMKQFHTIVYQVKSWLRTTFSWVHEQHLERYLNEFSFRINRSIFKETIFHKLIERMISGKHIGYVEIKISS